MTYESIKQQLKNHSTPCMATNENGETVIIETLRDDREKVYRLTTVQNNGWLRINEYYADGTITETYDR